MNKIAAVMIAGIMIFLPDINFGFEMNENNIELVVKKDPFSWFAKKPNGLRIIINNTNFSFPLEKVNIYKLRRVGIMKVLNSVFAIIEEENGKGYIIGKGTNIGKTSGKVAKIGKNSMVINEYVKDKLTLKKRKLKMFKKDGEF